MPCYHPLPAARMPSGSVSLRRADVGAFGGLLLPCGRCVGCQLSRGREWAVRCSLEWMQHEEACWVTLTYDEDRVPPTLVKTHLSGYVKRLRARLESRRIKHFGSGEYGDKRKRPHYHVVLFGVSDSPPVRESWKDGFVRVDSVSHASIAYVAGYTAKKVGRFVPPHDFIDYSTGEVVRYQPPFIQMSKRPGIGSEARKFVRSWRDVAVYDGREVPVPRYLHEAYKAHASPEELAALQEDKDLKAYERSALRFPARLEAAERIAESRLGLSLSRRNSL